ncbi:class I SAM-dependent methyltransferase [Pseudoroseicyclus tamaricis]|uniref:Class I SAM-dependent methyltransferase n=1 Tax=Pseudoroseicyclus tamaricis TaxID=2705421 RepID=A0A6B2K0C6_9RHOB|nr:methyltransferase [Pseudoroseicyclus tamaricis]NDU99765.1 class I SAM-dependent methyltransferase [Pseudoroseicyclus tamaricis]
MATSRLSAALDAGVLSLLAEGPILVLRPPPEADLAALPQERVRVETGFRPHADYWSAAGYETGTDAGPAALAIVFLPRSKAFARALIAEAAARAPMVVVDGPKTHGVDSFWREARKRLGDLPSDTRDHGRLFIMSPGDALADWAAEGPQRAEDGWVRQPGIFSEDRIDKGSALLAEALPKKLPSRMADFGAGWGFLAAAALERRGVESIDLIEAEALALECARANVPDPRAAFLWEDAATFKAETPYAGIVMNPPFHSGRSADPGLGQAFIAAARRNLTQGGQLWLVANRHLPYEAALDAAFSRVEELGGDGAFKLLHATRPRR